MIEEITVGIVVAGASYWILRKVLRHLAQEDVQLGGCAGCSGCSLPPDKKLEALKEREKQNAQECSSKQCCTDSNIRAD